MRSKFLEKVADSDVFPIILLGFGIVSVVAIGLCLLIYWHSNLKNLV